MIETLICYCLQDPGLLALAVCLDNLIAIVFQLWTEKNENFTWWEKLSNILKILRDKNCLIYCCIFIFI